MSRRSSWDDELAQSIVGLGLLLLILALIAAAWLAVRAGNQVSRGFAADSRNQLLWAALALFAVLLTIGVAISSPVALAGAGVALAGLLIIARGVELAHTERFQSPPSLTDIRKEMLYDWWPASEDAA